LYRSMLAFLLLFAGLYTSIFLINVIREISHRHDTTAPEGDVKDQKSSRVKEQKKR
jgi:hypothetical protein